MQKMETVLTSAPYRHPDGRNIDGQVRLSLCGNPMFKDFRLGGGAGAVDEDGCAVVEDGGGV